MIILKGGGKVMAAQWLESGGGRRMMVAVARASVARPNPLCAARPSGLCASVSRHMIQTDAPLLPSSTAMSGSLSASVVLCTRAAECSLPHSRSGAWSGSSVHCSTRASSVQTQPQPFFIDIAGSIQCGIREAWNGVGRVGLIVTATRDSRLCEPPPMPGPVCAGTERQAQPLSAGSRCWLPMLLAAPRSVDMGGSFLGCEQTSSCAGCGYVGALAGSACAARGGDTSSLPVEPLWSGQDTDVGAIEGARRALSTPRSVDMRGSFLGCEQTRPCAGCSYVRMLAGSACAAGGGTRRRCRWNRCGQARIPMWVPLGVRGVRLMGAPLRLDVRGLVIMGGCLVGPCRRSGRAYGLRGLATRGVRLTSPPAVCAG